MRVEITIVLAVFNGEKFILETLKSLSNQTFENFEVIIINDGSTDRTKEIAIDFCNKDSRFKLFNKQNGGVSSARNMGVEKAEGKYIIHHDVDDKMPYKALELMYENALKNGSDVVIGDYIAIYEEKEVYVKQNFIGNSKDMIQDLLYNKYHGGLWNKLINRDCYSGLSFQEDINYMEDKLFIIKLLLKEPKVTYTPNIVYHYVQNQESLTNKISQSSLDNIKKIISILEECFKENRLEFDLNFIKLWYKLINILNNKSIDHNKVFKEVNDKIFNYPNLLFRYKLLLYFEAKGINFFSKFYFMLKS